MYGALNLSAAILIALVIVAPMALFLARVMYTFAPSLRTYHRTPPRGVAYPELGIAGIDMGERIPNDNRVYTMLVVGLACHMIGFVSTMLVIATVWTSIAWTVQSAVPLFVVIASIAAAGFALLYPPPIHD